MTKNSRSVRRQTPEVRVRQRRHDHVRLIALARAFNANGPQEAALLIDEVRALTWWLLHPRS